MRLSEMLNGIKVEETNLESTDIEITLPTSSTDRVSGGCAFVCIKGLTTDSHKLCEAAAKKGAAVFITERAIENYPYVRVSDTRDALTRMWRNYCGRPDERLRIIGITGTNGKSTTAAMLREIFSCCGIFAHVIGTLEGRLTTPEPHELFPLLAQYAEEGCEYIFCEVSSHALCERRVSPINFELGIFTNLTPEHLDYHGNMQNYLNAKKEMFKSCKAGLFNSDDPYCIQMCKGLGLKKHFYSLYDKECGYFADEITESSSGIEYTLSYGEKKLRVASPCPGKISVYNTLCAISAAAILGIEPEKAVKALAGFTGVRGRLQRAETSRSDISVYIDYAHTPDALEKAISALRGAMDKNSRLVTVFGCGGDRDRSKRPVMGRIATQLSDYTIITSDNSRSEKPFDIIKEIASGADKSRPYIIIEDRRSAIGYAVRSAREGDVILLAGKGHENYEITASGRYRFSEEEILKEI